MNEPAELITGPKKLRPVARAYRIIVKHILFSVLLLLLTPLTAPCDELIRIGIHVPKNSVLLRQSQQYADYVTESVGKGLKLKMVPLPLGRLVSYFEMEMIDGDWGVGVEKYKNVPHAVKVSEPIAYSKIIVISRHNTTLDGWKSLGRKSIVYRRGVKVIAENLPSDINAVYQVNSGKQGLEMVLYERADFYIDFSVPVTILCASYHCKEKGLKHLSPPLAVFPLYLYLHKRFEAWENDLSEALRSVNQRLIKGELTIK